MGRGGLDETIHKYNIYFNQLTYHASIIRNKIGIGRFEIVCNIYVGYIAKNSPVQQNYGGVVDRVTSE